MTKVVIEYKDEKTKHDTNMFLTLDVDVSVSKDCPTLLAINSMPVEWYKGKTIVNVGVL